MALILAGSSCSTVMVGAWVRQSRDWQSMQDVGGMALGTPSRDSRGRVSLPIRCNVSGTEVITVRPKGPDSFSVCDPPKVRVRGDTIFVTIYTRVASSHHSDAHCPPADLGRLQPGRYSVSYLSPNGGRHAMGSIDVP